MESGADDQLHKAMQKKNGGGEDGGTVNSSSRRRSFMHPCNAVYVLMAASSGVLVTFGVAAICIWSLWGRRDEAYRWTAFYSTAVICLVASLWILRSVRAVVYYVRLCRRSDKVKVSVNPDITLPTEA